MLPCPKYIVPEVDKVFRSISSTLTRDEICRLLDVLYDPRDSNDLCDLLVAEIGYEPRCTYE